MIAKSQKLVRGIALFPFAFGLAWAVIPASIFPSQVVAVFSGLLFILLAMSASLAFWKHLYQRNKLSGELRAKFGNASLLLVASWFLLAADFLFRPSLSGANHLLVLGILVFGVIVSNRLVLSTVLLQYPYLIVALFLFQLVSQALNSVLNRQTYDSDEVDTVGALVISFFSILVVLNLVSKERPRGLLDKVSLVSLWVGLVLLLLLQLRAASLMISIILVLVPLILSSKWARIAWLALTSTFGVLTLWLVLGRRRLFDEEGLYLAGREDFYAPLVENALKGGVDLLFFGSGAGASPELVSLGGSTLNDTLTLVTDYGAIRPLLFYFCVALIPIVNFVERRNFQLLALQSVSIILYFGVGLVWNVQWIAQISVVMAIVLSATATPDSEKILRTSRFGLQN